MKVADLLLKNKTITITADKLEAGNIIAYVDEQNSTVSIRQVAAVELDEKKKISTIKFNNVKGVYKHAFRDKLPILK